MTIEDGLEELEEKKKEKKETENTPSVSICSETGEIMKEYIDALYEKARNNSSTPSFHADSIKPFAQDLYFTEELELRITPKPLNELIEVIRTKDSAMAELLQASDIKKYFKDPFDMPDKKSYTNMPKWLRDSLEDAIDLESIQRFHRYSGVIIPGMRFASLFLKTGAQLRKYYEITGKRTDKVLEIENNSVHLVTKLDPFDAESLNTYVKQTGETQILEMVDEVKEFEKRLNNLTSSPESVRNYLIGMLKKNNPQLIINGGQ